MPLFKKSPRFDLPNVRPLPITGDNENALAYVGTNPKEGLAQLKVLMTEECQPGHMVLEIGCGALVAGFPTMQFLEPAHYVGVDPNAWLIDASRSIPEVESTVREQKARFLHNDCFDGRELGPFDFILSHSILSHASMEQLKLFLDRAASQLNDGGKAVVSLRLAEGNRFGSKPSAQADDDFSEWVYPGNSYFRRHTVFHEASERGFLVSFPEQLVEIITSTHPESFHDWVVLEKSA